MFFNLKIFTAAVSVLAISLSSVMASESAENAVTFETPQALQEAASKITTKFEEGVHYKVIEGATVSEVKEVREFFSFFCGHCHAFLPVIRQVSYALPEDVAFVGNHVRYLGGPMGPEMQRAYASAVNLRVTDAFVDKVDDNVFNKHKVPQKHEDVVAIFEEIGIPAEAFENQYKSFPVMSQVRQYDQLADDMQIEGVPTVIVNKKYKIITGSIRGTDEYLALVDYLLALDDKKQDKQEPAKKE
jgi:thiol:disulfide interchange protein DsbA